MAQFEEAVLKALATLPDDCWQREDGLLCESPVIATHPQWFPRMRLWLLEKRGKIRSRRGAYLMGNLKSYQLAAR